jgi:inositol-hexakisphosphate 5-kinase
MQYFRHPSILDLKLGTQQHSSSDPPAKVRSKIKKCKQSTSATLGVRFGGSQVWRPSDEGYMYRDKYFGRKLTDSQFAGTLRDFFDNGCRLRAELLPPLIRRLSIFRDTILNLPAYRFYSSSLLLIYEGADPDPDESQQCHSNNSSSSSASNAIQQGKNGTSNQCVSIDVDTADMKTEASTTSATDQTFEELLRGESNVARVDRQLSIAADGVDIRLIDFAHADPKEPALPDQGMLLGIDSIIKIMKDMLAETDHEASDTTQDQAN